MPKILFSTKTLRQRSKTEAQVIGSQPEKFLPRISQMGGLLEVAVSERRCRNATRNRASRRKSLSSCRAPRFSNSEAKEQHHLAPRALSVVPKSKVSVSGPSREPGLSTFPIHFLWSSQQSGADDSTNLCGTGRSHSSFVSDLLFGGRTGFGFAGKCATCSRTLTAYSWRCPCLRTTTVVTFPASVRSTCRCR